MDEQTGHTNNGWTVWYTISTHIKQQLHVLKEIMY